MVELEQAIRDTAYFKWEQAGRPIGDGVEFWLESEREFANHCTTEDSSYCRSQTENDFLPEPSLVDESNFASASHPADSGVGSSEDCHPDSRSSRRSRRRTASES